MTDKEIQQRLKNFDGVWKKAPGQRKADARQRPEKPGSPLRRRLKRVAANDKYPGYFPRDILVIKASQSFFATAKK